MSSVFTRPMKSLWIILLTASLVLSILVVSHQPARAGGVLYAAPDGVGDCSSWANACTLQEALSDALSGDQIWVQTGVYVPGAAREDSFALKSGVAIYGGFVGSETALEQRDWEANPTILSGDIDGDDINDDGNFIAETVDHIVGGNSYHVVASDNLDTSAVMDGFFITAGQANGDLVSGYSDGGGMVNAASSPILRNLVFTGSWASGDGGGMQNIEDSSPILTNVIFISNRAVGNGGGMSVKDSSPSLTEVIFYQNQAASGGGMLSETFSSPNLNDVTLVKNSASYNGGGMYAADHSSPILTDVTFVENSAGSSGGGMSNSNTSSPSLTGVLFIANEASYDGGGMENYLHSSPTLTRVAFYNNSARRGGGMFNDNYSDPALTNLTFVGNSAIWSGGGIYNSYSSPTLMNVVFTNNSAVEYGGGMYSSFLSPTSVDPVEPQSERSGLNAAYNPTLVNVTFYANSAADGGGIANDGNSHPVLTNAILWGNTASAAGPQVYDSPSSSAAMTYSDVQGGYPGEGNIDQDPLFMDEATGDLRLQLDSPAVDAGNNAAVPDGMIKDLDDRARFVDIVEKPDTGSGSAPIVDIGAYEARYPYEVYLPGIIR